MPILKVRYRGDAIYSDHILAEKNHWHLNDAGTILEYYIRDSENNRKAYYIPLFNVDDFYIED